MKLFPSTRTILLATAAFMLFAALATSASALGILFTVNSSGDADDFTPGNGRCDSDFNTPGDQCTLRAAIHEVNMRNNRGTGTVNVTNCRVTECGAPNGGAISNSGSGHVFLANSSLVRNGSGRSGPGNPSYGGAIYNPNPAGSVTITSSTILQNITSSANGNELGAGIYNKGTVTITNSTICLNQVPDSSSSAGAGGGIYNAGNA